MGSSIFSLVSMNQTPASITLAPTAPTTTAAQGAMKAQGAVTPTRPASAPLAVSAALILPRCTSRM